MKPAAALPRNGPKMIAAALRAEIERLGHRPSRATGPARWHPAPEGTDWKFGDLPPRYWAGINMEPPFGGVSP